jgi:hypothetical protein
MTLKTAVTLDIMHIIEQLELMKTFLYTENNIDIAEIIEYSAENLGEALSIMTNK